MSLHAKISEEAARRLQKEERKSRILSSILACLVVILLAGILALFALPMVLDESPTIITYAAEKIEETNIQEKKVIQQTQRRPTAPAQNMAKVIAANTLAPTAIPVPDIPVEHPSLLFGDDIDFGQGWADDGFADATGAGGGFGSNNPASGGLEGFYYALEHARKSTENKQDVNRLSQHGYDDLLMKLQTATFPRSMLDKYYVAPQPLYLTHLAIPNTPSELGPELFGADWLANGANARNWLAHYRGTVVVPRTGQYRFSGTGDNYLNFQIDGQTVLHFGYAMPRDYQADMRHQSPFTRGWRVSYGKWIDLRAGQKIMVDIGIGDGGGVCGFHVQVETKDTRYKETPDGRPILPLFTTTPFSEEHIEEIKTKFPDYEFDFKNVLIFMVDR